MIHAVLARDHIEGTQFRSLSDEFCKKGRAYLRTITLRGTDTEVLNQYLDLLEEIETKIKAAESRIQAVCQQDEICGLLKTIPGIGDILAVTIRYEIDDIGRFISGKKLCSYAG
jgi:transposase